MVESSWLLETKSPQMMLLDLVVEQSFSGGSQHPQSLQHLVIHLQN